MSYTEEDLVDEDAVAHRGMDDWDCHPDIESVCL